MKTITFKILLAASLLWALQSCAPFADKKSQSISEQDSLLIMALADSAWNMTNMGDMETAGKIALTLQNIADTLPQGITKGDAYRSAAMYYTDIMDFENAITYYQKAEDVFALIHDDIGRQYLARTWLNRSLIHYMGGDYPLAIEYCSKAEPIFLEFNMNRHLINLYAKLSEFHDHLADTTRNSQYHLELIKRTTDEKDAFSLSTGYLSYAIYLMDHNQYEESEKYLHKMKHLADSLEYPQFQISYYTNMGVLVTNFKNDYNQGLQYYFQGLAFAKKINNPWQICDMLERISRTFVRLNMPDQAISFALQCLEYAQQMNNEEYDRKTQETLYNAYQLKNDYQNANIHLQRYLLLHKAFTDKENQKQLNYLTAKNETQRREIKIVQLEAEQQRKEAIITTRTIIAMASVALLLLTAISALLSIRNLRHKRLIAQREAQIKEQKISELEKEKELIAVHSTLKGEEAERSRIARDLHDGLGGLLSGVKLTLYEMKGPHIISEDHLHTFNHALELLDTSARELRRVAHNMMPEILHKAGLNTGLQNFCNVLDKQNTLNIHYNFFGVDVRLNPGFELAVYRMAQELINNAIKHASASNLEVQLIIETQRLCLSIADDGKGFDPNELPLSQGKGLTILRSRVASFNGRLDIITAPDKGAEFMVEFSNPTQITSND